MRTRIPSALTLTLALLCGGLLSAQAQAAKRLLVVTVTAGFRHTEGINACERVLPKLAKEADLVVDWVQQPPNAPTAPKKPQNATAAQEEKYQDDLRKFRAAEADYRARLQKEMEKLSPENLKKYDGVIFSNTTGDLPLPDREGFLEWVKSGKGFIGIHAATDTYAGFPAYLDMIGAQFLTHKEQVSVDCINQDPKHAACRMLGPTFTVFDEIYLVKNFDRTKVHGLLTLDKHPNDKTPGDYPIAWCKAYGQGKVFYTSLGHREDVWDDNPGLPGRKNPPAVAQAYQKHLISGIRWALGLEAGESAPQVQAK